MKRLVRATEDIEAMKGYKRSPYSFASDVQQGLQGMFKSLDRRTISQYFDDDALIDALDTLNKNIGAFKEKYDTGF